MTEKTPANILREQKSRSASMTLGPGEENHYRIWQDYTSPYSHKVMTYMNYKGVPYKRIQTIIDDFVVKIPELVGQSIIPVILTPDDEVMQDSTPMLEWFEKAFGERPAIPEDERLAFIMWLIEEFADEYMPRIHMHTRWGNAQNQNTLSHRIARGFTFSKADVESNHLAPALLERQSSFDHHLGLSI